MVTAIVSIIVSKKRVNAIAEEIAGMEGVSEVYSVSGNHDIIVFIRVKTNEEMAELITDKIAAIEGIEQTETSIAFRAFSKRDLEAGFSLGI